MLVLLTGLCLAPTPGDVGGCGQTARELDPVVFFLSKQGIDCDRCRQCGIETQACSDACEGGEVPEEFPEGCLPLVHDGTVCLRAITQGDCSKHRRAMSSPPRVPSECNFCPDPSAGGVESE